MSNQINNAEEIIKNALWVDKEKGIYRCNRKIFTDASLFELEMKYVFEGNWVYLAHESQIAEPGDYLTLTLGRQPIVITRDKNGELRGLINACTHKGATLCRRKSGNKSAFTCPFHGWTFSSTGALLKAKDESTGDYPDSFKKEGAQDLKALPRFQSYRGFLFGSLSDDVLPLEEYLGDTRVVLDLIVDQAPQGLEVLPGSSTYVYNANWKLQAENGADGYHVGVVHWNYVSTMTRRNYEDNGTQAVDANCWSKSIGGGYGFEHGHLLLWTKLINPQVRPVYQHHGRLLEEFGERRADLMVNETRNLGLYPNVYIMDQISSQIRVLRPIAVDKTEVTIYCFGPKGEDAASRALRIRQYEDFFNVSGMGTPDDLEEFRACQQGFNGENLEWSDLSRGAKHWEAGADEHARFVGMNPAMSGCRSEDEALYISHHAHWQKTMLAGVAKARAEKASLVQTLEIMP
ncbi:Rieske 2Fe-2S domain-containing protein [Enterobacillus tribolii]|uniref:Benzoate/toluate 1,2-dioxygenase alpha subunit n=1 Tax=Enterobacillus tribolii TaxID=1487935 RepID=A0A370Q718_9GAMM|nr:Rieske 2Fe-2S domain-containing protein [Enterobacillus tribolii]MBW7984939.1 benzoate 1,2-dioxygenase large subunit [Enterobacillus tribolii]RDK84151.1 benzoate/toluate 1,2-dioxygenase alpha subunit [Enterobacillus tribolii]